MLHFTSENCKGGFTLPVGRQEPALTRIILFLCNVTQQIHHAVRIAPLIVIPRHDLKEALLTFKIILGCG